MDAQSDQQDIVDQPVTAVMRSPVYTVTEGATLMHALSAMITTGRRHLAVVDPQGRCHGVLGDRAVAAAWAASPGSLSAQHVRRFLDARPAVVGADATVSDVARRMYNDGIDGVAVVDRSGHAIGIVTGGDLIRLMASIVPSTALSDPTDTENQAAVSHGPAC